MPGAAVTHRHSDLEDALAELARAQARTETDRGKIEDSLDRLARQGDERQAQAQANLDRLEANLDHYARQADERHARTQANLDRLEANLDRYARRADERHAQTQANLDRLEANLDQYARRADERHAQTQANLDRLEAEGRRAKEERLAAEKADRQKWGELANKMGTLVEDIIAPGIPTVFREAFGIDVEPDCVIGAWRRDLKDPSRRREFDAVAWAGGVCLVNETKSLVRPEDIPAFLALLPEVRAYWPQVEGCRVVGALASFRVDPSVVTAAEKAGLLMIGLGTGLLRILNSPGFKPREF